MTYLKESEKYRNKVRNTEKSTFSKVWLNKNAILSGKENKELKPDKEVWLFLINLNIYKI